MAGPVELADDGVDLGPIRPGDGVLWGQGCAEPLPLVDRLLARSEELHTLGAFVGLSFRELGKPLEGFARLVSYGALGGLGRCSSLETIPCNYSAIPRLLYERKLPCDVVMVQVSPPDESGNCSFGVGVDYLPEAIEAARVLIGEVNVRCPRTTGPTIPWSRFDAVLHTDREIVEMATSPSTELNRRIAANVAELVDDGDTLQLGVGALPEAIIDALADHRDLGLHTGMITDGLMRLIEAGVITGRRKPVDRGLAVSTLAFGSKYLFDRIDGRDDVVFRPVARTHDPGELAAAGPLVAINSAVEIDLIGQVNGERIGDRRIGAVGGQADFFRAAANGGKAILVLAGERIVPRLQVPVSTARGDVDWVVTEHGARSLRGLSDERREAALLELAGAQRAEELKDPAGRA